MGSEKASRVLEAAKTVFLRYGYKRTTMGDIAEVAGISRPALYLLFCNKERIFEAVLKAYWATMLEEIRAGLTSRKTALSKLRLAFDHWAVQPFTLLSGSPDAKDLIQCGYAFAGKALSQASGEFEAELVAIMKTASGAPSVAKLERLAHVLTAAVHGFKETAQSPEELREMIDVLLSVTLASFEPGAAKA
jgi:AcrR family transcriptional regulator